MRFYTAYRAEIITTTVIIILAIVFYLLSRDETTQDLANCKAHIYFQDEIVRTIPLATTREQILVLPQVPQVKIKIFNDHSIGFLTSDCGDHTCIKAGRLKRPGDFAACLPNHIYISLTCDNAESMADAVVR